MVHIKFTGHYSITLTLKLTLTPDTRFHVMPIPKINKINMWSRPQSRLADTFTAGLAQIAA